MDPIIEEERYRCYVALLLWKIKGRGKLIGGKQMDNWGQRLLKQEHDG